MKQQNPATPSSLKMLIVGSSGDEHTTLLMPLLLKEGLINYSKLNVFSKLLNQSAYQVLKFGLEFNIHKFNFLKLRDAG